MPAAGQNFSLGMPVEIGKIGKDLKKFWDQNETATRASLINLAVYSEEPNSLEKNTQLIAQVTEKHACRALVISASREASQDHMEAWISAHCHVNRAGSNQVCSEQISFLLEGPCTAFLPNIILSHLDSDLPFYLWWQGNLRDPMDEQLWTWVDRFIYDSQTWRNFSEQFRLVETAQGEAKQRIVLCDLNWTRLDKIRYALAQFFDHPSAHHHFDKLESVNIDFAPGFKSTAILLIAWLAAQLKWKMNEPARNGSCRFMDENKRKIDIDLHEKSGEHPINRIVLKSSETEFSVSHATCGDLLEVWRSGKHEKPAPQVMPAQSNELANLMSQELMRGGQHRVYLRALNCVRELL